MKYEILQYNQFKAAFDNWEQCSDKWEERIEGLIKAQVESIKCSLLADPDEESVQYHTFYEWEYVEKRLKEGHVVDCAIFFVRAKMDGVDKCPRCGGNMVRPPGISRRDNKTPVCESCSVKEAYEDMLGSRTVIDL